ncbi:hypothetical protein LCGC14_3117790 [marine sediment metagenome]|uniref:Uncharacterized protein n=1 Tax=marine sediment metagenome TaxID=412755 RepID=A0A0F8WS38_9ZZZZ
MKLDEAIEIKETELDGSVEHTEEELLEAEKLGIEALKGIQYTRDHLDSKEYNPLPGETKD